MWAGPLGQKDPLEEGMATYSSILAWRSPWTEEPGRLQSMRLHRVDTMEVTWPTHMCYYLLDTLKDYSGYCVEKGL